MIVGVADAKQVDDADALPEQFANGWGSGYYVGSRDFGYGFSTRLKATRVAASSSNAIKDDGAPIRWEIVYHIVCFIYLVFHLATVRTNVVERRLILVYGHVSIPVIQVVDTTPYIREQGNFARTINPTGDFCSTTDRV